MTDRGDREMKSRRKKGQNMGAVLSLQQHIDNKEKQPFFRSVLNNMLLDSNSQENRVKYINTKCQEGKEKKGVYNIRRKQKKNIVPRFSSDDMKNLYAFQERSSSTDEFSLFWDRED
jgi:hypothetical protein